MNTSPTLSLALAIVFVAAGCAAPGARVSAVDEHALHLSAGTRPLARFQRSASVPEGVDPVYARAGYLHPIFTPSGAVVTGDYCPSHPHQHGAFFAWTRTRFEDRTVDFWNAAEEQGVVRLTEATARVGDRCFAAELEHVDNSTGGVALDETWRVCASARADATVIDLESTQSAPGGPLEVLEYHYGGFAVRGPVAWEGPAGARAVTSEGHDRPSGNGTTARWVALCGPTETGAEATLAVLAHPGNPRSPEPVRIHPSNPYFCFAACRSGAFTIAPGTPRTTRYRIVAMDGAPDAGRLEELWREFASPGPRP